MLIHRYYQPCQRKHKGDCQEGKVENSHKNYLKNPGSGSPAVVEITIAPDPG